MSIIRHPKATNVGMKTIVHDPEAGSCKVTVMRPLINVPPRIPLPRKSGNEPCSTLVGSSGPHCRREHRRASMLCIADDSNPQGRLSTSSVKHPHRATEHPTYYLEFI